MQSVDRVCLGTFPTPFHELKNLSRILDGPRIFVKRDDLTGLALGGNKVRKLEYIMADAQKQQADVIITIGATTSNHARQTAAAAVLLGMDCHLILIGREPAEQQGNYLLDHLLGAKVSCVPNREVETCIHQLAESYRQSGKKTYVIPAGGHNILGLTAYRDAYQETREQAGFEMDAVIAAIGTGTTFSGLYEGCRDSGDPTNVIGISVGGSREWCEEEVLLICHEYEKQMQLPLSKASDLTIMDDYIGEGYTKPYPRLREVIRQVARTEGILLDPVYSGKAMVGLIDLIQKGYFNQEQKVVFLHTGGAPELFTMNKFLSEDE